MKDIGEVIKLMRKSKGLTLKQLSKAGISVPFLSKVENNHSHLSSVALFKLTDFLNLELEEAEDIYHTYTDRHARYTFFTQLQEAVQEKDVYLLNELVKEQKKKYTETHNVRHFHGKILAEAYINYVSKLPNNLTYRKILTDYLWSIPYWSMYELQLFSNSLPILHLHDCHKLLQSLNSNNRLFYMNRERTTRTIIKIKLNMLLKHLAENELENLAVLLKQLEKELHGTSFYNSKNKLHFIKGVYLIKTGHKEQGQQLCKRAIEIMYDLDDPANAHIYQEELHHLLAKTEQT